MASVNDISYPVIINSPDELQSLADLVTDLLQSTAKDPSQYPEAGSLEGLTSIPCFNSVYDLVRVSIALLKGVDGKEVELQVNQSRTYIQWRYIDGTWNDLIAIEDLKGSPGENPVFRATSTALEWKYASEEDSAYRNLVDLSALKGETGDYYEFRTLGTMLQKKLSSETEWVDIFDFSTLNGEDGKTPILETVEVVNGSEPSGDFIKVGEDVNGNPKYKLSLIVQKGTDGQPPLFEQGTTTTGLPNSEASVEVIPNGYTPEGNPKYTLNFTIPRGEKGLPGEGFGNVFVDGTGLISGKKYLFVPSDNDSTEGTFVEYSGADYNVTDPFNSNYIKNKPEIPTLGSSPTTDTLTYINTEGTTISYKIGDEVRVLENGEYVFYKLYDLTSDGKAVWKLAGSGGGEDAGNILLGALEDPTLPYIQINEGGLGTWQTMLYSKS